MISRVVAILLTGIGAQVFGQSLGSMNFNYCYDSNNEIEFALHAAVREGKILAYYSLTANRKEFPVETYSITWQNRKDFNDRTEEPVAGRDSVLSQDIQNVSGIFSAPVGSEKWYLVAKVVNRTTQNTFHFFSVAEAQWPIEQLVNINGRPIHQKYSSVGSTIRFQSDKKLFGFYYKKSFEAAPPPFAESDVVSPFLIADSTFSFSTEFTPRTAGLYLFQSDTASARGVCLLVADGSYPKYTRVASLAPPLIYISTDEEFVKLSAANADKTSFDKVILEITGDKDRARNLFRSYFQRVEQANRYFTDYKEGWKTDRGMLYVIYGKPDEVSRTATGETWYYQGRKTKFEFKKSGSVFNPENFKLERDNKYMPEWFSMVDLWRKSRF
jgi:GWxTD domain-containing protein